jgi:catalase
MLFLTRWFGVTGSDAERNLAREKSEIEEIVEKTLLLQRNAAIQQQRPLCRGTHAKGVCARAEFEVLDVAAGRGPVLAARLAKGIFRRPGVYPAIVRFGNADPKVNSDFKPDLRSLSFSVDLTRDGMAARGATAGKQDFSLQNTKTLPINDATAFLAFMKLLTASNPAVGLWSLPFRDKLRVLRTLALVQVQTHQKIKPYQQLRYESDVPFRHGPIDIVKYSATPISDNPARPLQRSNPKGLQDELIRHLKEDGRMSGFDFGVQFLDIDKMTYWGKRRDANFWIENASVEWNEAEVPFHTVARLTLLRNSQLQPDAGETTFFDVTGNSTPDSRPVGSINRARWPSEVASRKARANVDSNCETTPNVNCLR